MDSDSIETGGGSYIEGNVHTGGGTFIGRDQNIIKIESQYYVSGTPPLPLHSILDEPEDDLPLLSAGRAEELAKLDAWYEAVRTDKTGEQPRLFVITGQRDIGKRELLQHWRSMLLQRTPTPTVAVTGYLPGYIGKAEQEFYYSDHPGWRSAWVQFAALLRSRYRYTEALGGLAWIALAAQIVDQSKSAKAQLNRSIPSAGDMDARSIQRQMSDLLLAAVDDGPLILILERVDEAQFTVLQPLLQVWRNVLHNVPFLLVLTVNIPAPLHSRTNQSQENDWLTWIRTQTAPHNAYSARYLHLDPLTVNGVRQLLATDAEAFAADLHHITNGVPSLIKELLHHWQQQGEADYQADGRWRLHPEAFTIMPGTIYQRYIVEPLQDCAAYALEHGYGITWETLLDWLQYAVWEGEVFTDEALAYAVDMHGEELETFQEILDEVLARREDGEQSRGLLVELQETVVLPTAELERSERYMALYRFEPPLLARILYYRQHGQERQQRGERYIQALLAAYQPFAQQIAPRLQQICRDLGRARDAEQFLRLIAPLEEIAEAQATLAAMRVLAETDPLAQQQLVRYTLEFVAHAFYKIHPRPFLPLLEQALQFARKLEQKSQETQLLTDIGNVYSALGDREQALVYFQQALSLHRAVSDRVGEAITLHNIGNVYSALGDSQQALVYFQQALPLRRAVSDRGGEAVTLTSIGGVYSDLGEQQQALSYYEQALPLHRAVSDHAGEAVTLTSIGNVYSALGERQQALAYYEQALPLHRVVGNRVGEASTLHDIGIVYSALGEQQQALVYFQQALPLHRVVGSRAGEASTLTSIGNVYSALGERQQALVYFQQALPLHRMVGSRAGEASTLHNSGNVYSALGDKQQALAYYEQALLLERVVGDRAGEASTLRNIGSVYSDLGDKQQALAYYEQALSLHRAVGDRAGEASTLHNIGRVYSDLGERQQALAYYEQALLLERAVSDRAGEASTLHSIGNVYSALDEQQQALSYYEQALPLRRAVNDHAGEASTLNNIGSVYSALGERQQALVYFQQALLLERAVGDRAGEASTLHNIGSVYSDLGEQQQALAYYEQVLSLHRAVDNRAGEAVTLMSIGIVYSNLDEQQQAFVYFQQALSLHRAVNDHAGEASTLHSIGIVYSALGEQQQALVYFQQALPLFEKVKSPQADIVRKLLATLQNESE